MTKIMVIGNAGGGKSTLCRALGKALSIPHFSIDKIQWKPGWQETPPEEINHIHSEILERDTWIIDGYGPWASIEGRAYDADTIIYIDLPLWLHFWWATKRQIRLIYSKNIDQPNGCSLLSVTLGLYKMLVLFHFGQRVKLQRLISTYGQKTDLFHIKTSTDLNRFYSTYCQ